MLLKKIDTALSVVKRWLPRGYSTVSEKSLILNLVQNPDWNQISVQFLKLKDRMEIPICAATATPTCLLIPPPHPLPVNL